MTKFIVIHSILFLVLLGLFRDWNPGHERHKISQPSTPILAKAETNQPKPPGAVNWSEILKPGEIPMPYQIVDFLRGKRDLDLRPLWQSLNISKPDNDRLFQSCNAECDIEHTRLMPLGEVEQESILRIGVVGNYRYLVFDEREPATRFFGFIDVPYQYDEASGQRIVTIGAKGTWLVLTTGGKLRTGASAHFDTWYDLNRIGIPIAMSYPSAGDEWNYGDERPGIWFYSRVISGSIVEEHYTIDVLFVATYRDCLDDPDHLGNELFNHERKVRYIWNSKTSRFVIDSRHSQLTEKELRSIYAIDDWDSLTNEQLLSYNHNELANLTVSGKRFQKHWLSAFLRVCKRSPGKKNLSAQLARHMKAKS